MLKNEIISEFLAADVEIHPFRFDSIPGDGNIYSSANLKISGIAGI